jgi:hypothetical protein
MCRKRKGRMRAGVERKWYQLGRSTKYSVVELMTGNTRGRKPLV